MSIEPNPHLHVVRGIAEACETPRTRWLANLTERLARSAARTVRQQVEVLAAASGEDVELVSTADLCLVVGLALETTLRSPDAQDALVRLSRLLDNDFVRWSGEAERSWDAIPCTDCGLPMVTAGPSVCPPCSFERYAQDMADGR